MTWRFIPACAGNATEPSSRPVGYARFIPACAGNACSRPSWTWTANGSSPRVRGTLNDRWRRSGNAGSSPRVRGTPPFRGNADMSKPGSSPRVRGTHDREEPGPGNRRFIPACAGNALKANGRSSCASRFIPACAGNAPRSTAARRPCAVHPRVCGERARQRQRISRLVRFIPACAGNACKRGGDNAKFTGSSPRVRGTLGYAVTDPPAPRFIPACAGNATLPAPLHCNISRFIPACAGNALQGKPLKRHSFYDVKQRYRSSRYVQSPRDDWTRPFSGRARFLCDAFVVTLTRRLSLGRQEGYEPKAVEVHRHPPIGAAGLEFETGIIV